MAEPLIDNQSTLLASSIAPPDAPGTFEVQNGAAPAGGPAPGHPDIPRRHVARPARAAPTSAPCH